MKEDKMPSNEETLKSLIDQVIAAASSQRDWNRGFRTNELAQRKQLAEMQFGQGGSYDRSNLSQEKIAGMQYGPNGTVDRRIAMEQPKYTADAAHSTALTKELDFKLGVGQDTRPGLIGSINATNALNTATNNKELADLNKPPALLAKPKKVLPPLTTPFNEMDIQNEQWQPFGTDSPNMNWWAKRFRNIGEAPRRFLNEVASPFRNTLRMP
jgi:hypothetical protein